MELLCHMGIAIFHFLRNRHIAFYSGDQIIHNLQENFEFQR